MVRKIIGRTCDSNCFFFLSDSCLEEERALISCAMSTFSASRLFFAFSSDDLDGEETEDELHTAFQWPGQTGKLQSPLRPHYKYLKRCLLGSVDLVELFVELFRKCCLFRPAILYVFLSLGLLFNEKIL